jgi:hypothetical protein
MEDGQARFLDACLHILFTLQNFLTRARRMNANDAKKADDHFTRILWLTISQ